MVSPDLLRAALEERIRMGPETRRPAADRLADRARRAGAGERAAALAEADRAVAAAGALAREYQGGRRTQADVIEEELQRRFPWLGGEVGGEDLARRLGNFGYYLMIM